MVAKRKLHSKQRRAVTNCMTCANAHLMQWDNDPVVCQCSASGHREVASAPLASECAGRYTPAAKLPLEVEHIKKKYGI